MDAPAPPAPKWSWKRDVAASLFVILFSSTLFAVITKQWLLPAGVPRAYANDYVVYLAWAETMIEEGSYLHNSRVGQPLGTDWRGFPTSDGWLNWQVIRLLAWLNPDPAWVLNWFYWLTFPLVGLSAFAVARLWGLSRVVAVSVAVLYDFLPYHILRFHMERCEHVFLAAYYIVPWSLLACLRWRAPTVGNRGLAAYFGLAVLTGLGHAYYAFFAVVLMLAAGTYRARNARRWAPGVHSVLWGAMTTATLLLTMLPEIRYAMTAAPNPDSPARNPAEAEVFGLKIVQMILPVPDHQIPALAQFRAMYQASSPLVNENETAALGAVGSVGLLFLLARAVFRRTGASETPTDLLAVLALVIVLLAAVGGFASVINWAQYFAGIQPWVRGYNRISVFLAFVSLLALGALADNYWRRLASFRGRMAFTAGAVVVTAAALIDQTPRAITRHYAENAAHYESDREFFPRLEARASRGDFVFILGYRYYPECPTEPLIGYDHFRPYLHTKSLTFSYGALRGEPNDAWCMTLSAKPPADLIDHLARMDAHGLLVYRPGYTDQGNKIEEAAEAATGVRPIVSPDQQFAFYDLRIVRERLKAHTPADEWSRTKARLRHPLTPVCGAGFLRDNTLENPADVQRDFGTPADVRVSNGLPETRRLEMRFTVTMTHADDATETRWLRVSHGDHHELVPVPPEGAAIVRVVEVPPGETVIRLVPALTREEAESGRPKKSCWMHMSNISWAER